MKISTDDFLDIKRFLDLSGRKMIPLLEVRINALWGAGSRQVIYTALKQPTFSACSLTEKIIYFEAWEMMQEETPAKKGAILTA